MLLFGNDRANLNPDSINKLELHFCWGLVTCEVKRFVRKETLPTKLVPVQYNTDSTTER